MNKLFQVHKLNNNGMTKAVELATAFETLYEKAHEIVFGYGAGGTDPNWEGREWAIAKSKLEEACFYAKKTLAQKTENQDLAS